MSEIDDPPYVAKTLEWCNGIRAEKGMELLDTMPKGKRDNPVSCPCGEATGVWVDRAFYVNDLDEEGVRELMRAFENERRRLEPEDRTEVPPFGTELPEAVKNFVYAFDMGSLPQYDLDEGRGSPMLPGGE